MEINALSRDSQHKVLRLEFLLNPLFRISLLQVPTNGSFLIDCTHFILQHLIDCSVTANDALIGWILNSFLEKFNQSNKQRKSSIYIKNKRVSEFRLKTHFYIKNCFFFQNFPYNSFFQGGFLVLDQGTDMDMGIVARWTEIGVDLINSGQILYLLFYI